MITLLTKEMITPEMEQDAHRLFSMLSRRYQRALSELFEDKNTAPYVAGYIEDGRLHGMASMAVYKVISGYKGWIEDVVVDEFARGKKIGTQLIQTLISKGRFSYSPLPLMKPPYDCMKMRDLSAKEQRYL